MSPTPSQLSSRPTALNERPVSLASPIFGYALGQYAADWLAGKSVPLAIEVLPSLLTPDNIAQTGPTSPIRPRVWNDIARREIYLRTYGSISCDTRAHYLNFAWSSES